MILPLLPVFATDSAETETNGNITMIYSNDFDENIDGWVEGAIKANTSTFTLDRVDLTEEDSKVSALALNATKIGGGNYTGTQPSAYLNIDDIEFTAGNKIIIEMRFKQTGDANGNAFSYLKYNRPNKTDYQDLKSETEKPSGYPTPEDAQHWWNMLRMQQDGIQTKTKGKFVDADTVNNWTDVRIVIDEKTQKYSVTTKTGNVEGIVENDSIATTSMYELQCFDGSVTGYDSLDSLTLYLRNYAQTLYVDYFRVYEATPVYADAQILGGSTVEAGKTADIQFINVSSDEAGETATTVGTVPEGAVTINGAKAVQTYNAETQTISVKPAEGFKEGETYTIALNETVLSSIGMNCTGTNFTVTGRGPRSKGLVINNQFNTENDVEGWAAGATNQTVALRQTTKDGLGVLEFKSTGTINTSADGNNGNIIKAVGNGIEFKEGKKIVIKTKVMKTSSDSQLEFKWNRPNTISQIDAEFAWQTYGLFWISDSTGGTSIAKSISPSTATPKYYTHPQAVISNTDLTGKWVEYTLELDGVNKSYTATATVDKTNYTKTGLLDVPYPAYEKVYGSGTIKQRFDSLDTLTFMSKKAEDTVYIDYIQVYEEDAFATAAMSKTQYKKGEAPAVVFDTDMELTSIPEGAVTTEGFEATASFDSETKTLTLTPNGALKAGTTYTVKVDAKKLEEIGMFYTSAEKLKFSYIGSYAVYDTFDTGTTEGWVIGVNSGKEENFEYGVKSIDDRNALMIKNINTNGSDSYANVPNYIKDFDDITFVDGEKVIIEATVMQTGDIDIVNEGKAEDEKVTTNNGIAYLKYNRPDVTSFDVSKELGANYFTLARFNADGYSTWTYNGRSSASNNAVDLAGKWIKFKLEIDGKVVAKANSDDLGTGYRTMKTTYTIDGTDNEYSMWLAENTQALGYAGYTASEELSAFPTLSSLTFLTRRFANELYVDEIKVYVIKPFTAQAQILGGSTVESGKTADIQFINVKDANGEAFDIDELPNAAVKINGTAAKQSYNPNNQTLSVKPADGEFAAGETYTIELDTDVLSTIGMNCTGTNFTVTGRGPRSKGLVVNDSFNDGDASEWKIGNVTEGYEAEKTIVPVPGEEGNYALQFTMKPETHSVKSSDKIPNIIRRVGNGIEFNENSNIIIKAKIKATKNSTTKLNLKYNRPDTLQQVDNDFTWMTYGLMSINAKDGVLYPKALQYLSGNGMWTNNSSIAGTDNSAISDKWVEYTIKFNGYDSTISVLPEGASTPIVQQSLAYTTPDAYRKEFGYSPVASTDTSKPEKIYDALDTLTFTMTSTSEFTKANEVYLIDYIQVYEEDAVASVEQISKKVRDGKGIEFKVNTTAELTEAQLEGAVTVEGIDTTYSYDAENKIITLMPVENITEGTVCNITVNKSVFEAAGLLYDDEADTEFTVKSTGAYIINDQFRSDLGDWKLGKTTAANGTYSLSLDDTNEYMVLSSTAAITENPGATPNAINDFDDVAYTDNSKLVIKTKFKQVGNTTDNAGVTYLKFNRPDKTSFTTASGINELGVDWYTFLKAEATALKTKNNNGTTTEYQALNTLNEWIEVEIVIDGTSDENVNDFTFKAKVGDTWYDAVEGSMIQGQTQAYDDAGVDKAVGFTSLNSLTWLLRKNINTLYVDYFTVQEIEAYQAYAVMPEGSTVEAGDAIDLTFYGKDVIDTIPAGAVKINDTAAAYNTAITNNTLSIKPSSGEFEATGTYKVTIDAKALESVGMNYTGTTEFNVRGRGVRENNTRFVDNFDSADHGWTIGAANDDYKASMTVVTPTDDTNATGAEDGSALKVSFKAAASGNGNQSTITKSFGNGFEFVEGKEVTVEMRVKKTAPASAYLLKINRPDEIEQVINEYEWRAYAIMGDEGLDSSNNYGGISTATSFTMHDGNYTYMPAVDSGKVDFSNKWVNYTIKFTPENGCYWITAVADDGTILLNNRVGANGIAKSVAEKEYGVGTDRDTFNALESLTFYGKTECDIYIDYVKVYDTTVIDEKISAKLTTDGINGVDSFTEGDTVKPVFELHPKDGVETTYYAISAKYVDGKLADKHIEKITTTGETHTDETGYTIGSESNVVIKAFVWSESFIPLCSAAEAASDTYTVYVRTNGADNATGSNTDPVATLDAALNLVYNAVEADGIEKAKIVVGDGNYTVNSTITIPTGASVPANGLTITKASGETPIFVGGNTYTKNDMVKIDSSDANYSKIPEDARNYVYKIELGVDAPALSYPGPTSYRVDKVLEGLGIETPSKVTAEAAFDGTLMTVARWPNTGYSKTTSGSATIEARSFLKDYDDADEVKALSEDDKAVLKTKVETGAVIGVDSSKDISKWANAKDALLFGYWYYDWATQTIPLGSVSGNTVTTKYASTYGAKAGARFYIYNLLEELDTENEYYIDRTPKGNDVLYFYKSTEPADDSKITLSLLEDTMINIWAPNITLDGLTFENSRGTAVALSHTDYVTVKNCTMRNLGSYGVSVYAKNCNVLNNNIYDTNGGIIVGNEDATIDTQNLPKANNYIYGNTIKRFSRLDKVYIDGINLGGIGNKASYNHISEGEHLAARVTGNFNEFSYNEITNVLNETDDAGAIYMGRSWTQRGNKIISNYIHDLALNNNEVGAGDSPVAGIFLDDHYAGAYIEGNVFVNIKGHGVRTNRGRENTITNNLFVNCTNGGAAVATNLSAEDSATTNDNYSTQYNNIQSYMKTGVWYESFPEIADTLVADWAKPEKNVVTNNYSIKCGTDGVTGVTVGAWPASLGTVSGNVAVASDSAVEGGAYGVTSVNGINGFKAIDFANMRK